MRTWRCALTSYKGRLQQNFSELQAIKALENNVSEAENTETNYLSILIKTFRSYDSEPSTSAYSFIITYLFRRRMLSHIPPILDHLEKAKKTNVPESIFVNAIKSYGNVGLLNDAVDIFFRIPQFGCIPSVVSLNSLIFVLCKKKEGIVLVRDVLLRISEMNIRLETSTFCILIRALCRHGKLDSAIEILNEMSAHECTPDATLYSLILSAFCIKSDSAQVIEFLEAMRNAGFLPDLLDYSNVINKLMEEGKVNDAYSVLTQMRSEGRKPTIMNYNSILNGFVSASDFQKVDNLFDEILLIGVAPNAATYNAYICGLCKQGNLKQASQMIRSMERVGCSPDMETFNPMITACLELGEFAPGSSTFILTLARQESRHQNAKRAAKSRTSTLIKLRVQALSCQLFQLSSNLCLIVVDAYLANIFFISEY